jgi:hypothetical protein
MITQQNWDYTKDAEITEIPNQVRITVPEPGEW